MQHKLQSLTELLTYKENITNVEYRQCICSYCIMKTTFYYVGCSDLENDQWFHTVALALQKIAIFSISQK